MALIDDDKKISDRLASYGWHDLLLHHGLDMPAKDLKNELLRELPNVSRETEGFADFASEGKRGKMKCSI
jgi:hypothetical protein